MLAAVVLLVGTPFASAAQSQSHSHSHHRRPNAAQRIAAASSQLSKLSARSFARRQRARVLASLSQSVDALHRHRTCAAISALDRGHGLLLAAGTWRRGPPRSVKRTIAPALNTAERGLVAGAKNCGALSYGLSRPAASQTGGEGFTPTPSYTATNDQGDSDATRTPPGVFRPRGDRGAQARLVPNPQFASPPAPGTSQDHSGDPFGPGLPGRAPDAGDFQVQRSTNIGVPGRIAEPQEMTTAIGHNVVWYTGNVSAAYSLDGGRTWSGPSDPSTSFLPDPANNALCCDQQVVYSSAQNLFVWILQYYCPPSPVPNPTPPPATVPSNDCKRVPGNNIIRFAVASPEEIRAGAAAGNVGAAWHIVYDMTPQSLGEPANAWFDYSTVAVNDEFVNYTVDIIKGTNKAVAMRINLASLGQQHRFQANYFFPSVRTVAAQQPPGETRSLFATNNTLSQTRVYDWTNSSTTPLIHDVNHASIPDRDYSILGSDGNNWNKRADITTAALQSAAWTRNELIVANPAGRTECLDHCGNGETPNLHKVYPYPGAWLTTINTVGWYAESAGSGKAYPDIWSEDFGVAWPQLGVARDGEVGISYLSSAQNANPVADAGILDPHGNNLYITVSNPAAGPQPGFLPSPTLPAASALGGGTGDYYSMQPGPALNSFVMPFRSVDPVPGGNNDDWHFATVGHGQAYPAQRPLVLISSPTQGASFLAGAPIGFHANASDSQDVEIPASAFFWYVDGKLTTLHGDTITLYTLPAGDHTISVNAVNSVGLVGTRSVSIHVVNPAPGAPVAFISSPLDGTTFAAKDTDAQGQYVDVQFQGGGSDPAGKPLTYTWDDLTTNGDGTTVNNFDLSHDPSPTLRLHTPDLLSCTRGRADHKITLTADNNTQASTATIHVYVVTDPSLCGPR